MEYRKDKRTKNLTLRDIHVGDWVQVWSEQAGRYSPPLKIIQICDDGTIYLVTSDEERPTPWEEDIKNVDALPITPELLKGFGFEVAYIGNTQYVGYNGKYFGGIIPIIHKSHYELAVHNLVFRYMHEFTEYLFDKPNINLEWKGIEK